MMARATLLLCAALLAAGTARAYDVVRVTDDAYLNYMPSLIERADGSLMIAYERLDSSFENGDVMVTSSDDGAVWTTALEAVAGPGNERHPALVELADGGYQVYYLSDETGGYRIHWASSPDGTGWTPRGTVDLGWTTENLVNPAVWREEDGSLTMTYDYLSNGGYIAHSDDGITWDHGRTSVSDGSLNRVMRHSGGTYVASYQKRTGAYYWQIDVFTRVSPDRVSWSPETRVTTNQNSHDPCPIELADGQYALYYAKSTGGDPYDLRSVVSDDGTAWHSEEPWLAYGGWDTQPHPVLISPGAVAIAWPRGPAQTDTEVHFAIIDPPTDAADEAVAVGPALVARPNPSRGPIALAATGRGETPGRISIFDTSGRLVCTLEPSPDGGFTWDGTNGTGERVASGVYLARAEAAGEAATVKIVLVR